MKKISEDTHKIHLSSSVLSVCACVKDVCCVCVCVCERRMYLYVQACVPSVSVYASVFACVQDM